MKNIWVFTLACLIVLINVSFHDTLTTVSGSFERPLQVESDVQSNESMLIDEFAWSVLRYQGDISSTPGNFGKIKMTKPTPGSIVIPINMICYDTCCAAVSIYHNNKMDTVKALDDYDIENMIFRIPFMLLSEWARSKSFPCYEPTSFAHEMGSLGELCPRADFVGHCYSQSLFNTAVLRLCGFSAEEVFTLTMPLHAVTIFQVQGQWYIFDSTPAEFARRGLLDSLIRDSMNPPLDDIIMWLENDKYFINFGAGSPTYRSYLEQPFSNMDPELLITIIDNIVPLFNNSKLGYPCWNLSDFLSNAIPCPEIKTIQIPNTVSDAIGYTIEEKIQSLLHLNIAFIKNQTGEDVPNQYDRSLYGMGDLSVEYPQAYANAAKYATITSWFASKLDKNSAYLDCMITSLWIKLNVNHEQIMSSMYVSQSDFLYLRHAGSSVDKAILAYGTLRNMKKDNDFWPADDLYVLITDDNQGYLAVNLNENWKYLSFEQGGLISNTIPDNIGMVFNEIDYSDSWGDKLL